MTGPATIRVGVFYRSLPMVAADEFGFAAEQGIAIEYDQVASSKQQFEALHEGVYDCVQTSPDNVANYRLNGRSSPLGEAFDVQAFMGLDYGMNLRLVARPGVDSVEDLKGGVVAVDAPASGFAYVLYEILQRHGLRRDRDYGVVLAGGNATRYTEILQGSFDATLLGGGLETRAESQGFTMLDTALDIADPYLGVVAAASKRWLDAHADEARRLVAAWRSGAEWAMDPSNETAARELLKRIPNTSDELAHRLYEINLTPGVGIIPDGSIDSEALKNVLRLRQQFGGFDDDHDFSLLASSSSGLIRTID